MWCKPWDCRVISFYGRTIPAYFLCLQIDFSDKDQDAIENKLNSLPPQSRKHLKVSQMGTIANSKAASLILEVGGGHEEDFLGTRQPKADPARLTLSRKV